MPIKGLIFDFDGLILDTETPEFEVWQEIYQIYQTHLPLNEWQAALGASMAAFDPIDYLAEKTGQVLDHDAILTDHRRRSLDLIHRQPPQPGIRQTLDLARKKGLKLGVASSSPKRWVHPLLEHLEMIGDFDKIICRDHVSKVKPDPELFLRCQQELGLEKSELIIFEDSPNGIRAANNAGIFCVAIPNTLTRQLDTSHADLVLSRIDEIPLDDLMKKASQKASLPKEE